ncbi:septal ring lytic transglycosylase RlpA family protein, partial [Roseomonas sp. DSM 102946]|nr:septal ring lytic transglycosylase RlpA family protein [Roseomonas sp. DSM 102946]
AAPHRPHASHHTIHHTGHHTGQGTQHRPRPVAGRHPAPRHGAQRQATQEQRGHASVYSRRLAGRPMADGGRFDPGSDTVASRTLPLGTQARVTNLRNGRSAVVSVRDRGPHRGGRILDVSPGVAARLGMPETGTAPVAIVALSTPGLAGRAEAAPMGRPGR